jgi:hypothetical protein
MHPVKRLRVSGATSLFPHASSWRRHWILYLLFNVTTRSKTYIFHVLHTSPYSVMNVTLFTCLRDFFLSFVLSLTHKVTKQIVLWLEFGTGTEARGYGMFRDSIYICLEGLKTILMLPSLYSNIKTPNLWSTFGVDWYNGPSYVSYVECVSPIMDRMSHASPTLCVVCKTDLSHYVSYVACISHIMCRV